MEAFIQKIYVVLHNRIVTFYVVIQMVKHMNHGKDQIKFLFWIFYFFDFCSFTVHGFRYVQVIGSPNSLSVNDLSCPVVHSETTLKGHFSSSNAVINQIQHNVQWGQLGNSMSLPTDW